MFRTAIWALAIGMIVLQAIAASAAPDRVSVTVREANVRSAPSLQARILWKAEIYYPLQIVKKQGEWIQFRDYEGDQGWIHQSVVGPAPTVITIKENCNVRANPSLDAQVLFNLESGFPLKVYRRDGKWLYIETGTGKKGWIFDALVW